MNPTGAATVNVHARRMNRVIDHIDAHLDHDLRLDTLARLANFSPFHFHRLFRAWTGETLLDFVRRRRLEAAGGRLRHLPHESVTEVALGTGFASAEAFARAFKQHFGQTPTAWRRGGFLDWERRHHRPRLPEPMPLADGAVTVQQLPAREVMYWRLRGDYTVIVDQAWARFIPWVQSLGLGAQPLLGMGLDDPGIAPPSRCRFDACVVLPPDWNERGLRASHKQVAGGLYAVMDYDGPDDGVDAGWRQMLAQWLPTSGHQLRDGSFFEAYAPGATLPAHGRLQCKLCMPVRKIRQGRAPASP